MPRVPNNRCHRVHDLVAESLTTAPPVLGRPSLRQAHHLTATGITVGEQPPLGRTAQENGFATLLKVIFSASPDRRTKSKKELLALGTRRFGLSKRRANAIRESVIDRLGVSAWSRAGAPRRPHRRTRG
jgi:hypothetical protein